MSKLHASDEPLVLLDEELTSTNNRPPWLIVLIDDEPDVHAATTHALREVQVLGRPLKFINAYSRLIDGVMESDHAGLELVRHLRVTLGNAMTRIVLRTGQPGYAPELEVMRQYDINDYRTKSELTFDRLVTTLTAAIRAYQQIVTLENSRRGLDLIVRAAADLSQRRGLAQFAEGVIHQIAALLGLPPDGLLCVRGTLRHAMHLEEKHSVEPWVVAAAGTLGRWTNQPLSLLQPTRLVALIGECLTQQTSHIQADCTCLYFRDDAGRDFAVYLDTPSPLSALDQQLLQVFSANISSGFDNVSLVERLEHYAFVDPYTSLPNRTRFLQLLDAAQEENRSLTMALIDIKGFAEINNSVGHQLGDDLLCAIGIRLVRTLGQEAVVARISGDVFGVFGPPAVIQPNTLMSVFAASFPLGSVALLVTAAIGLVAQPNIGINAVETLKYADIALQQAKQQPEHGFAWFAPVMEATTTQRLQLLQQLRLVAQQGGLQVFFQPQINLDSGELVGVEALLRWQKADGSYVRPDHFIPLAEASGDIISLGDWVLHSACQQLAHWSAQGLNGVRMAVNISLVQFRASDLVGRVATALRESGVEAQRLELEITESVAMTGFDQIGARLGELKALGVQVAIDDFGTGFSSLSYLQELAIDRLKIDKSFVASLPPEPTKQTIAKSIVRLAQDLGIPVIAEGVENAWQADYLRSWGCQEAQGFLYAPALEGNDLLNWARARRN